MFQPVATPAAATPVFVKPDLRIDIAAVKAIARVRFTQDHLGFVNRYSALSIRRRWSRRLMRQVLQKVRGDAGTERNRLILAAMPAKLHYTPAEAEQIEILNARMAASPVSMQGNARYNEAAAEFDRIHKAAFRRTYDATARSIAAAAEVV